MKKTLLMIIALMCAVSVYAQPRTGGTVTKEKNNALFLGPKFSIGSTSASGQPKECKLFDGRSMGFGGGGALKARFGKADVASEHEGSGMFGAGLEVRYFQHKLKTTAQEDLSLGYLEIPVLFQFYPIVKSDALNGFYIEVGPDFAMLMSKSPDALIVQNPSPTVNSVTFPIKDLSGGDLFKGGDLRVVLGLGYTVPGTGLDINARYYIGTSELAKESLPTKLSTLEVSLAWMFKIGKF